MDQVAVRCVIADEQRPDAMSAPLGITPTDNDKFLPVKAFDLEPRTPVGLIAAIDALRDDTLQAVLTGQPVELRAMPDLVVVVPQAVRRTLQQRCQPGLALHQRQSHQVLAVQKQQVEEEENQRSLTGI